MWSISHLCINESTQHLLPRLQNLRQVSWSVVEITSLSLLQRTVCTLKFNNFTWRDIQQLTGISSPNTISSILRLTACSVVYHQGRQGGSYSVYSETILRALRAKVNFRRRGLNCLTTYEAKQLILEELEEIKKRAIRRLTDWGCANLVQKAIDHFDNSPLTPDIFRDICEKCDLFILTPENLELVRRKCCNHPVIDKYFMTIENIICNFEPQYKFNADETGLASKRIFRILTDEKGLRVSVDGQAIPHISCMLCYSEAGSKMKPFFIFPKRETMFSELEDIPDIFVGTSSNGWMTSHLWDIWCISFVSMITEKRERRELSPEKAVLLFVDGHLSRLSPFGMRILHQYNIVCLVFPSHTSHILQPFDVDVSAPLKNEYIKECINKLTLWLSKKEELLNAQIIRRLHVIAFISAWNKMNIGLLNKSFFDAGIGFGHYGKENLAQQHLLPDPTVEYEPDENWKRPRLSPLNGKIATDNLNLLDPYQIRRLENNKWVIKDLSDGDFSADIIAAEWYGGNSTTGKIFNDLVPIYANGTNIMHAYRRSF